MPIVMVLVLVGPSLWGGKVFLDPVHSPLQYSFLSSLKKALDSGDWFPVWDTQWANGYSPWLLPANFGLLNPVQIILTKFLDFVLASHVLIFVYWIAGFYAAYFAGRALNLSRAASTIVGLAYAFNSYNVWWGHLLGISFTYFLLPFLFLALLKIRQGKRKFIFWSALFIFLAWPNALTQIFLYSLVAAFVFALYTDKPLIASPERVRGWLATKSYLFLVIPGTLLALFWLIPIYNFLQISWRAGGLALEASGSGRLMPWDLIFTYTYPSFSMPRIFRDHFMYVGILPFILAVFSLGYFRKDRLVRFFSIGYLFLVLATIPNSPIWRALNFVPVINLFRQPYHVLFVANFFLAVLAGFGLDGLSANRIALIPRFFKNFVKWLKVIIVSGLALALTAALITKFFRPALQKMAWDYFLNNLFQSTKQRPLEHYYSLINGYFDKFSWNVSFSNPYFLTVLFTLAAVFALFLLYHRGRLAFNSFKIIAVAIVALDLLFVWRGHFKFAPRNWIEPAPAAVFLRSKDPEPFRIFNIGEGYLELEKMGHNINDPEKHFLFMRSRLYGPALDGVDSAQSEISMLSTRRQFQVMEEAINNSDDGRTIKPTAEIIKAWQSPQNRKLLSMMNVKYIFSSFEFSWPWKKIFETKPVEDEPITTYVYENTEALPRIYFANSVNFAEPDDDKALNELLTIANFKSTTLVECMNCTIPGRPSFGDNLEIVERRAGYLKVKTRTQNPRYLVFSESNLPYWEAKIDGEASPIYTANYLFQSVLVPHGEHLVEFNYPGPIKQFNYSFKNLIKSLP